VDVVRVWRVADLFEDPEAVVEVACEWLRGLVAAAAAPVDVHAGVNSVLVADRCHPELRTRRIDLE
jgi:hypothetical protein